MAAALLDNAGDVSAAPAVAALVSFETVGNLYQAAGASPVLAGGPNGSGSLNFANGDGTSLMLTSLQTSGVTASSGAASGTVVLVGLPSAPRAAQSVRGGDDLARQSALDQLFPMDETDPELFWLQAVQSPQASPLRAMSHRDAARRPSCRPTWPLPCGNLWPRTPTSGRSPRPRPRLSSPSRAKRFWSSRAWEGSLTESQPDEASASDIGTRSAVWAWTAFLGGLSFREAYSRRRRGSAERRQGGKAPRR